MKRDLRNDGRRLTGLRRTATGIALVLLAVGVLATNPAGAAKDDTVGAAILRLFGGLPQENHVPRVLFDPGEHVYYAFHLSDWMGVKELRVYRVPEAEAGDVAAAVARGDHQAAYETVMNNFGRGALYVSDVGLDGITGHDVVVGSGKMRDYFSPRQFATPEDADQAYHQWLRRAVQLLAQHPSG